MRCIFHLDMDAFFASVEIVNNPELKGKPVIIGGRPDKRGVVSTCSYEARNFGVRSAMPTSEAYRLCPHAIFIAGNYHDYRAYSEKVFAILYQYTPFVEVVSIDEAYLDVTGAIKDGITPKTLATNLKKQVFDETKLTCSIGIATNKLVAKIAVSKAKPNGIYEVFPGYEAQFLSPLPIQTLPGIGKKTQIVLNREGYHTISDLQKLSIDQLVHRHGTWGYYYHYASKGEDNRPVDWEEHLPKSIGAEITFEKDQNDLATLAEELNHLLDKAYRRLRSHKMRAKRISLKLRYNNFKTISRSITLTTHFNDIATIQKATQALFHEHYTGQQSLRLIGVSLEQLSESYWQPTLF